VAIMTPLLLMLFGGDFAGALPVTLILLLGLLARAAVGPAEQLLIMTDNQLTCAYAYGWAFVINVALCVMLVPLWGSVGAALATAAGYTLASLIIAREVKYAFGFPIGILSVLRQHMLPPDPRISAGLTVKLESQAGASSELEKAAHAHSPFAADAVQKVVLADGAQAQTIIVRETGSGTIIGVWPMRTQHLAGVLKLLKGPNDAQFETDGDPVISAGRETECLSAIAAAMQQGQLPTGMILAQNLTLSGPTWQALEHLQKHGVLALRELERWHRPMLAARLDWTADRHIGELQGKRKLDGVLRRLRRLRDRGEVAFKLHRGPDALPALERFLELEAKGWKGASGTAIAQNAGRKRYMQDLGAVLADTGHLAIVELTLKGETIASGVLADRGGRYTFLRTTYDQTHASTSPGTLLDYMLIDHLLSNQNFKLLDAGTDSSVEPGRLLFADTAERANVLIAFGHPIKAECVVAFCTLRGIAKTYLHRWRQAKYRSRSMA
jgi:CelD/BcsL family acetyltransferase involved in cellulose biosynthesis